MRKTILFLFVSLLLALVGVVRMGWAKTALFDDGAFVDSDHLPLEEDLKK